MKNESDSKRRRVRRQVIATLVSVASVALLGLVMDRRLTVVPPAVRSDGVERTRSAVSPTTYGELSALELDPLDGCDIALMNLLCAHGLANDEALDIQGSLTLLDEWASRVRSETQRHFYQFQKTPREFEHSEGYFRMLMMAVVLHEDFQVRYNPERIANLGQAAMSDGFFADSRDVFLHGLLSPRRMGTCSSMPVLYAALGRRLGYPLKLVTTKGHLFVRWEGSAERFNVDATGQGMNRYHDDHYRTWPFPLSDAEISEQGYLKSLTAAEELAVFLSIRAQCLMESGRDAEAVASLEHAVRLRPAVRDQALLLAQAQAKRDGVMEPQPSVSRAAPAEFGQIPSPPNANHSSDPVPDPNPLRQIR
jgi:hypothetical protein